MTDNWTPDQPLRADASDNHISERLAGICTHPGGWRFPNYDDCTRVAHAVKAATVAEYEAKLAGQNEALLIAINWLMGCGESFSPPTASDGRAPAPFWWRSEFSARAGCLHYNGSRYVWSSRTPSLETTNDR